MKPANTASPLKPRPMFLLAPAVMAVFALLALAPGGDVLAASPWPMFQHDVQHTGRSPFVGPQTNRIRCEFPLIGNIANNVGSPAIAVDGTIYIPSGTLDFGPLQGFLFAVNPDCTQQWVYSLPGPPSSTAPTIAADGTIYIHSNGGEGNIAAIERLTAISPQGTFKWECKFNLPLRLVD